MRNTLMVVHRWLALVTALVIIVIAASGSALVFEGAIDRALNPQLWQVEPGNTAASLDSIAAHARVAVPNAPLTGLGLTIYGNRAVVAQVGAMQVFVDPWTASVNGTRDVRAFQKTLPRRLHVLHTALLAGKRGSAVVTWVTIVSLILLVTGIFLWWPDKLWRIKWTASWKRIVFDLHHVLGIASVVVLVIITASGIVIHYDGLRAAIARLDSAPRPVAPEQSEAARGTRSISLDSLARIGRTALPGAEITFLTLPPKSDEPFVVAMRFPEDRTPGGRSRVVVDRYTGDVLLADNTRNAERGTKVNNVLRSVHTGDLYGNPTRFIWLLAAIVLVQQAVSGALMWWNARRKGVNKQAGVTR